MHRFQLVLLLAVVAAPSAVAQSPHPGFPEWIRGKAAEQRGDLRAALELYDSALALEPRLYSAYRDRSSLKARLGDNAGAKADYEKAFTLLPPANAYYYRALDHTVDTVRALAYLDSAIAIDPKYGEALLFRDQLRRPALLAAGNMAQRSDARDSGGRSGDNARQILRRREEKLPDSATTSEGSFLTIEAAGHTVSYTWPTLRQRLLSPKPLGVLIVTFAVVIGSLKWATRGSESYTVSIALRPGEELLWAGVSNRRLRILPFVPAILFGMFFGLGGLVVVMVGLAVDEYDGLKVGIPFMLTGMGLALVPMIDDVRKRARQGFAVTSKRLVMTESGSNARERSIPLENVRDMAVLGSRNDRGTLYFLIAAPGTNPRHEMTGIKRRDIPSFKYIDGITAVQEIIIRAREHVLNEKSTTVRSG